MQGELRLAGWGHSRAPAAGAGVRCGSSGRQGGRAAPPAPVVAKSTSGSWWVGPAPVVHVGQATSSGPRPSASSGSHVCGASWRGEPIRELRWPARGKGAAPAVAKVGELHLQLSWWPNRPSLRSNRPADSGSSPALESCSCLAPLDPLRV
ncbi:unnamed protein product [Urochloa humidicola]